MSHSETKLTFFRQSGWMVIAATLSGVFMFGVHIFNRWMPEDVYGAFGTSLALMTWLQFPVVGLQQTVAQQGAAALTDTDRRRQTYTARRLLLWTFLLWLVIVTAACIGLRSLMATFSIQSASV
ncbi:MAG: hypothetical protein H7X97_04930, partial [Opitutaceae bacterium]|nr:hypothetical protein [Verrucomicrobiales bacterium]